MSSSKSNANYSTEEELDDEPDELTQIFLFITLISLSRKACTIKEFQGILGLFLIPFTPDFIPFRPILLPLPISFAILKTKR